MLSKTLTQLPHLQNEGTGFYIYNIPLFVANLPYDSWQTILQQLPNHGVGIAVNPHGLYGRRFPSSWRVYSCTGIHSGPNGEHDAIAMVTERHRQMLPNHDGISHVQFNA